jgi:uncharacterized membrane protein
MQTIEKSIDVEVSLDVAYDQWTQFETFPQFMEGVERVEQLDDRKTHWVTRIGGVRREYDAEINLQRPDRLISWHSVGTGTDTAGRVSFDEVAPQRTKVTLQMGWNPGGVVEQVGDRTGMVERRVQADLERFRTFIEARGSSTGGWRGSLNPATGTDDPGHTELGSDEPSSTELGSTELGGDRR